MTPEVGHEAFAGLTALYALGGLDGPDRVQFEQHLEVCASCVSEVRSFLPVAHGLAYTAPVTTVPPSLRERIVGPTPPPQPERAATPGPPRTLPRLPAVRRRPMSAAFRLAALVCVVVAGGLGWIAAQQVNRARDLQAALDQERLRNQVTALDAATSRQLVDQLRGRADVLTAPDLTTVALEGQPDAESASGRVFLSAMRGGAIAASGLPPLPPGRTYHVWFVLPAAPVGVGAVGVDSMGNVLAGIALPEDLTELIAVAVTIELEGAVDAPSGSVVLLGRTDG